MSLKWFHKFHRVHNVKTEEKKWSQLAKGEQKFPEIKRIDVERTELMCLKGD